MSLPARSATAETIQTLRGSVIPALNLARAGVTGIGVPGIEGAVTCIFELAKMVSTMKGNKKALEALKTSIDALAAATLEVSGAPGDLETRLTRLSSVYRRMIARSEECEALSRKSRIDRFMRSDEYSRKILDIRNGVADDLLEFTVCCTILLILLSQY
ncbi:hypothetical protein B0H11DRAFT_1911385 [Mycena galericulata]|nr:hypothetical protein B0H11DRAFT_1911385 [Mycena galericulata]